MEEGRGELRRSDAGPRKEGCMLKKLGNKELGELLSPEKHSLAWHHGSSRPSYHWGAFARVGCQ